MAKQTNVPKSKAKRAKASSGKGARYEPLRKRLLVEEARLKAEIEHIQAEAPALAEERKGTGFSTHMAEEAWGSYEREQELSLEERLASLLAEVRHSLDKFERGTYGTCDNCRNVITYERLEARPQANFCLNCQAFKERSPKP